MVSICTLKATRIGTFAALCIGVALSGMVATTVEVGLVGRYKSCLGSSICKNVLFDYVFQEQQWTVTNSLNIGILHDNLFNRISGKVGIKYMFIDLLYTYLNMA